MKILLLLFTLISVAGCKSTPTNMAQMDQAKRTLASESVSFGGKKAVEWAKLMDKVEASEASGDPCTAGACYEQGQLYVICRGQDPMGGKNIKCEITNTVTGKLKKKVTYHGAKARLLAELMEKVKAVDAKTSTCQNGKCFEAGTLAVDCKYPNGPHKAKDFMCAVGAAPQASAQSNQKAAVVNDENSPGVTQ